MKYFLACMFLVLFLCSLIIIGGCRRYQLYADPNPPAWWAGLSSLHAASRLITHNILMLEKNNYQPELRQDPFDEPL